MAQNPHSLCIFARVLFDIERGMFFTYGLGILHMYDTEILNDCYSAGANGQKIRADCSEVEVGIGVVKSDVGKVEKTKRKRGHVGITPEGAVVVGSPIDFRQRKGRLAERSVQA